MSVLFSERAAQDADVADAWWRANRDARELFSNELVAAVLLLAEAPRAGQRLTRSTEANELRRLILRKTRYLVFYAVTPTGVDILRIWHPARRPEDVAMR